MKTDELDGVKTRRLAVGRITGVHGLRGEVKITPYGEFEGLREGVVRFKDGLEPPYVVIQEIRRHRGQLIAGLKGYTDRGSSEALVGREVYVRTDELPELSDGEFYVHDLMGMDVWSEDGRAVGKVTGYISAGGNGVFEVSGQFGDVLIPSSVETIKEVDRGQKKIIVRLIEGLIEINRPSDKGKKG